MYGFRIIIDVTENDSGIHQLNTVENKKGRVYNSFAILGALEQAKIKLYNDIEKKPEN